MEDGDVARALGHIPAGLFIVTALEGEKKDGYLASWVQQASFDPLLISLALKEGRPCYGPIAAGGIFAVNVVGEHETDYLKHFWKGYRESPFDKIPHKITHEGALLIQGAKSAMVCRAHSFASPGDHKIVFARVLQSHVMDEVARVKVHLRKSGLTY